MPVPGSRAYFFSSFLASAEGVELEALPALEGEDDEPEAGGVLEPLAEPEAEPDAEPEAELEGGVLAGGVALLDEDDDGELEEEAPLLFEASSPHAERASAAAAAIRNALVIPVPLERDGGSPF